MKASWRKGGIALVVLLIAIAAAVPATGLGKGQAPPKINAADLPNPKMTPAQIQAAIKHGFFKNIPAKAVSPIIIDALKVASMPVPAATQALALKCVTNDVCDTGHGTITIGIADPFGDIPWRKQARLEVTMQALMYPQVKRIIYTNGHAKLQQTVANFKSLITQKADVITGYFDFASAVTGLTKQASKKGIAVVPYISDMPGLTPGKDVTIVAENMCAVGTDMALHALSAQGPNGQWGLLTGVPGNPTGDAWQKCVKSVLSAKGWTEGFNGTTGWTPAGELKAASDMVATGKPINAVFYDYSLSNVLTGYQRAGATLPAMVSWGQVNEYYLASQKLSTAEQAKQFLTNNQTWLGRISITAAMEKLAGKNVPGRITVPQPIVSTPEAWPQVSPTLNKMPISYGPPTFAPAALIKKVLK